MGLDDISFRDGPRRRWLKPLSYTTLAAAMFVGGAFGIPKAYNHFTNQEPTTQVEQTTESTTSQSELEASIQQTTPNQEVTSSQTATAYENTTQQSQVSQQTTNNICDLTGDWQWSNDLAKCDSINMDVQMLPGHGLQYTLRNKHGMPAELVEPNTRAMQDYLIETKQLDKVVDRLHVDYSGEKGVWKKSDEDCGDGLNDMWSASKTYNIQFNPTPGQAITKTANSSKDAIPCDEDCTTTYTAPPQDTTPAQEESAPPSEQEMPSRPEPAAREIPQAEQTICLENLLTHRGDEFPNINGQCYDNVCSFEQQDGSTAYLFKNPEVEEFYVDLNEDGFFDITYAFKPTDGLQGVETQLREQEPRFFDAQKHRDTQRNAQQEYLQLDLLAKELWGEKCAPPARPAPVAQTPTVTPTPVATPTPVQTPTITRQRDYQVIRDDTQVIIQQTSPVYQAPVSMPRGVFFEFNQFKQTTTTPGGYFPVGGNPCMGPCGGSGYTTWGRGHGFSRGGPNLADVIDARTRHRGPWGY